MAAKAREEQEILLRRVEGVPGPPASRSGAGAVDAAPGPSVT